MPFPKTLGAAADLLYTIQQQRLELVKQVKELTAQEEALKTYLIENMLPKAGLDGVRGKIGQISLKSYDYEVVEDWDKFHAYVGKNKSWELLQKRASITALRELWDNNKEIPGVKREYGKKIHVSKI